MTPSLKQRASFSARRPVTSSNSVMSGMRRYDAVAGKTKGHRKEIFKQREKLNQLLLMQPTTNAKWSLNRRDNNSLTTLEDADSTQFYWWLDKSGGKGSSLDFKTFRCSTPSSVGSHERKRVSWRPTDDGVEHRNVLKSKLLPLPPDLSNRQ